MKVQVYIADSEMDASIVKGNLESAGIAASITSGNDNSNPYGAARGVFSSYLVYVEEDKFEEAKKLLDGTQ